MLSQLIMAKKLLLWMDLEMTGLDEKSDKILEIAAIITDYELNSVAEKHYIFYQPDSVLESMNDWCKEHHGKSGLTELVRSGWKQETVESELVAWVKSTLEKSKARTGLCLLATPSTMTEDSLIPIYQNSPASFITGWWM